MEKKNYCNADASQLTKKPQNKTIGDGLPDKIDYIIWILIFFIRLQSELNEKKFLDSEN